MTKACLWVCGIFAAAVALGEVVQFALVSLRTWMLTGVNTVFVAGAR
jgi:hypothetical protein